MAGAEVFKAGYVINDRFEINRLLGQGGFAMVFEGTDRNLDRQVAIKILHGAVLASSAEDHRVIERFEREAKLAASVDHPSVVNIYDAGEIDALGEPFIVMEYLRGESLQDHLDEHGAMEASTLLPLFKDVLMGLGYAHELGIVHKDLKPDNIFYRYPGTMRESLCIVDFGIAHIGRSNSGRVTRDGEFFGTPSYMPPEYISEQKVSAGFDVYQMGLILIECLTGQSVVYHEDAVATLLKHLNRQFRIPQALLESEVWPVLERALAADPKVRYANALEFAEALHAVPMSAWPGRHELIAGAARGQFSELPTIGGGLGEAETEAEETFAETWKQESSFRTQGGASPPVTSEGASSAVEPATAVAASSKMPHPSDRASGVMDATEERDTKRSLGLVVGLIAVSILVAGGILMALLDQDKEMKADSTSLAVVEPDNEATPPREVEVFDEKPAADVDVVQEASEVVPVHVKIAGEPTGATILNAGGEVMGKAPFDLRFDSADASSQRVTITMRGYEDLLLDVSAASTGGVEYTLEKAARRKERPAKKAPVEEVVRVEESQGRDEKTVADREPSETKNEVKIELPGQRKRAAEDGAREVVSTGIILPK